MLPSRLIFKTHPRTVSGAETKFVNLSEMEFELFSDEEIEAELLSGKCSILPNEAF